MTAARACQKCGVDLDTKPSWEDFELSDPGQKHTLQRCNGLLAEKLRVAEAELQVAWADCHDGSCHACPKCWDAAKARVRQLEEALRDVQRDLLGFRDGLEGRLIIANVLASIVRILSAAPQGGEGGGT